MDDPTDPQDAPSSGLSSCALLDSLAAAFRNESMDIYDKIGRGAINAADQRMLLRSEILKDISNAISRANRQ